MSPTELISMTMREVSPTTRRAALFVLWVVAATLGVLWVVNLEGQQNQRIEANRLTGERHEEAISEVRPHVRYQTCRSLAQDAGVSPVPCITHIPPAMRDEVLP